MANDAALDNMSSQPQRSQWLRWSRHSPFPRRVAKDQQQQVRPATAKGDDRVLYCRLRTDSGTPNPCEYSTYGKMLRQLEGDEMIGHVLIEKHASEMVVYPSDLNASYADIFDETRRRDRTGCGEAVEIPCWVRACHFFSGKFCRVLVIIGKPTS